MQVLEIERKFKYNSVTLPDPNPSLSPDQIREFYATQFPELNNAVVEGPITKGRVATWTFTRAAGAKGAGSQVVPLGAADVVRRARLPNISTQSAALAIAAREGAFSRPSARIAEVCNSRGAQQHAMHMPAQAFGLWG